MKWLNLNTIKLSKIQDGLFGVDINYEDDINDNIHILQKYKENINEINITKMVYDMHHSELFDYFKDINCKIALLQNLSIIYMNDEMDVISSYDIYSSSNNLCYIYEDKMTFFIYKSNDDIKSSIIFLNIMNINKDNTNLLNNLPPNIEYLHISSYTYDFDNLNLPINLKKFTITLINNEHNNFNIKLPFGCDFEYNYIMY